MSLLVTFLKLEIERVETKEEILERSECYKYEINQPAKSA